MEYSTISGKKIHEFWSCRKPVVIAVDPLHAAEIDDRVEIDALVALPAPGPEILRARAARR